MTTSKNVERLGNAINSLNSLPNTRMAEGITNRDKQIMTWILPNGNTIQMYINPENFVVTESKQIQAIRTKGGFVVQYWGDNLTKLTLNGTTGSSGVKGINVLRDIYKSENITFEQYANAQTNKLRSMLNEITDPSNNTPEAISSQLTQYVERTLNSSNYIFRPTLASLAVGVILFYQGIQYKGFFNSITVTENTDRLGIFSYNIEFTVTDTFGHRDNFMAWHKEPLADDLSAQLMTLASNAFIGLLGMKKNKTPTALHPESAYLSYGGNSLKQESAITTYQQPETETITNQETATQAPSSGGGSGNINNNRNIKQF